MNKTHPLTDLDLINQIAFELPGARSKTIRALVEMLIDAYIISPDLAHDERDDALNEEIQERARSCDSDSEEHLFLGIAAENAQVSMSGFFPMDVRKSS